MTKNSLLLTLLLFVVSFPTFLFSQAIIEVKKTDHKSLNKLEELNVKLCFEMDDYLLVSPQETADLDAAKIPYRLLTSDNNTSPLYIISAKPGFQLQKQAYLDEILINDKIRLEKAQTRPDNLLPQAGIKFIPIRISSKLYRNKASSYSTQTSLDTNITRDLDQVLESVNADSIASYIQTLEDYGSRFALLDNRREISDWIASQFTRFGYTNVAIDSFYVNNYNTWQYNVVCIEEGSVFPDQYVVIGGHHDSIITPNINEAYTYAPGADDNASGTAAVLETARVLKENNIQLNNSLRFVTFAMEEFGLFGGYHDAEYLADNNVNVVAMLNSDMISNSPSDDYIFTLRNYPGAEGLTNLALANSSELDMTTFALDTSITGSDSWAYHSNGFKAIFFAEYEFSPYYHSDQDISENTNPDYAAQFIKLVASTAISVGNLMPSPENFTLEDTGSGTSVNASWDEVNIWGVEYKLDIKNLITDELNSIFTVSNSYTIEDLEDNTPYEITLFTHWSDSISFGETRFITPQSRPRIVENFSHQPGLSEISFTWQANSELDLAGYKIYRKAENESDYSLLASISNDLTSYIDNDVQDHSWYNYVVTAYDFDDNESDYSESIVSRPLSFNAGIGILDFTTFSESNLLFPAQTAIESFYEQSLNDFSYDLILASDLEEIKIETIGIYSTLIIFKNSFSTTTNSQLVPILNNYSQLGGNLLISAADPLRFLGLNNETYPATFTPNDLANQIFGINQVDNNSSARFARGQSIYWDIPDLEIDPDKIYPTFDGRVFSLEALVTSDDDSVQNLLTYQSDLTTSPQNDFDDYIVALSKELENSQVILTSIPLYFIKNHQAKDFLNQALMSFNESVANDDNEINQLESALRLSSYPNPFNPATTISFYLKTKADVHLKIYNIKGQLVYSHKRNNLATGQHMMSWDGQDKQGKELSSGLYLYKLTTDKGLSQTNKMILMK